MSEPDSIWLRRAGRGRLADDGWVLWSVAEGERGRRWRWMHQIHHSFLDTAGLVELSPEGEFRRLELTAYGGLLTFHPDAGGLSAHGNIVGADGVHPIETSWRPGWSVGLIDDPFGSAAAGWTGSGLVIDRQGDAIVWREPGTHPDVVALPCDARGVPVLADAEEWPLEA